MPRVHVQKARTDIYRMGAKVESTKTKSGFRTDRSKPANDDDTILISKGQTYYKWSFRYGGTHRSLKRPKPSQLTQSGFLQQVYSVGENVPDFETKEDVESWKEETISELEELREQTEESLNNMPEQLQYAPTGELLQERIDALENWVSELEQIECDDEDIELQDLIDELPTEYEG